MEADAAANSQSITKYLRADRPAIRIHVPLRRIIVELGPVRICGAQTQGPLTAGPPGSVVEPCLRRQSPQSGNIRGCDRRLSANFAPPLANRDRGDRRPNRKIPCKIPCYTATP